MASAGSASRRSQPFATRTDQAQNEGSTFAGGKSVKDAGWGYLREPFAETALVRGSIGDYTGGRCSRNQERASPMTSLKAGSTYTS